MRGGWALVLTLAAVAPALAAGRPEGTPASRDAMAACARARAAPAAEQERLFTDALAAAERAVAAAADDALAHFAVFCALGGRMERQGISLAALTSLRRLRQAVDRTLALAPDYAAALAGKGSLLCETPRLLGGDCAEGEALLRRAIRLDPGWVRPRLTLAEALLARGARAEAASVARAAVAVAERDGDAADTAEAKALVARIGTP
ncbi:MAG: hypothetical protein KIT14_19600 [bacterium]|nr:hypothetical protein [bacterium]